MKDMSIIVAGHICLDITPIIEREIKAEDGTIFTPGRLISVDGVTIHPGGCVANTGLAFKKLGADVQLMAKIGTDAFGKILLEYLESHGVAKGMIVDEEAVTSYSVVLAPPNFDRMFIHDTGANNTFSCEDLDFEEIKKASLFHYGYPTVMKKMHENDGSGLVEMYEKIHSYQVATSLDLSIIDPSSAGKDLDWKNILKQTLPFVDFFVPSIEELIYMVDRNRLKEWISRAKAGEDFVFHVSTEELENLADIVLSMGTKVVLIKCGARGMYLRTASEESLARIGGGIGALLQNWGNISHFECSYKPERVASATGAGDSSIAAFLYAVTLGYDWRKCLQMATGTGASCVEEFDGLSGLRSFSELEEKIQKGWEKQ